MDVLHCLTPEQYIAQAEFIIPQLSPEEAKNTIEHVEAWSLVYYRGTVPRSVLKGIADLKLQEEQLAIFTKKLVTV